MAWVRVDDKFHGHRKALRAWREPRALGLYMLALCYCADHLTDGVVDVVFVESKLPGKRERDRVTAALVDAGLWEVHQDGFMVHDYLEYNQSRDVVEDRLGRDRRRKRADKIPTDSKRNPDGFQTESERIPNGFQVDSESPRLGTSRAQDGMGWERTTDTPSKVRTDDARKPPRASPDSLPEGFPGEQAEIAQQALAVLLAVHAERGGDEPTLRGVGLAIRRFPKRDHLRVVGQLEHWALAGTGQRKKVKDWARTFARFLETEPDGTPMRDGLQRRQSAGALIRALKQEAS